MQEQPQVEARGKRQQLGRQSQRDAVQALGQEQPQIEVGLRHQCQRRQKMGAELPVGRPGLVAGGLKGQQVDEDGPAVLELYVVCRGIFEHHAMLQGQQLDAQGQQRGVLQLGKRPLVGVGNKRDLLHRQSGDATRNGMVRQDGEGNQVFFLQQRILEARFQEQTEIFAIIRFYAAADFSPRGAIHSSGRIAERSGDAPCLSSFGCVISAHRGPRLELGRSPVHQNHPGTVLSGPAMTISCSS